MGHAIIIGVHGNSDSEAGTLAGGIAGMIRVARRDQDEFEGIGAAAGAFELFDLSDPALRQNA
jgi:stage V sporulation protein SpoVS